MRLAFAETKPVRTETNKRLWERRLGGDRSKDDLTPRG